MLFSTFDLTEKKSCLLRKQKIIWKDISGIYLNISKLNFFFNSTGYQILITYHDHNLTYSFTVKGGIFGGNFKCLLRGGLTYLSIIVRQAVYVVAYVRHYLHSFSMSHEGLKTLDHRHNLMYVLLLPESLIFSE